LKELLTNFHFDCLAESDASETHKADKHKMALSSQQKAMSVLWYWETK
jgi:hypothetical protein